MRSQRHSSLFQSALHLHYAWSLMLCTQHCRHVHSYWSGAFNLLKFDHISKKERLDTLIELGYVSSETTLPANILTGAKRPDFSANHLANINTIVINTKNNTKTQTTIQEDY